MGGGAWPFLVGGVICLVDSDNERDSTLLTSRRIVTLRRLVCIGRFVEMTFTRSLLRVVSNPSERLSFVVPLVDSARVGVVCVASSKRPSDYCYCWGRPSQCIFLEGSAAYSRTRKSNNRSVMPLDVLGRTRATM